MKKIMSLIFLALLSPFIMEAIAQPKNYNYTQQNITQPKLAPTNDQTLSLTNDMLGIHGPFSLQAIYSRTLGLIFAGKYTQLITKENAFFVELNAGKAQRRVAATLGQIFTSRQWIKVTAENLSQNKDFDFDAGKTSHWVYQNAIGVTYAYLFPHSFVQDINLNAYYSKALSKNLAPRIFTRDGLLFRNYRHIAGAADKSASIGIDVKPTYSTLLGAQLNYDDVYYNMRYESQNKNSDSGLGATVTLDQLITDHVKFNLLASYRKPYSDYKAELDWLLNSVPGTQLQLGLLGERIIGNLGLANDSRFGLEMSYAWGGNASGHSAKYTAPTSSNIVSNFSSWVTKPAVHMEQVLAIRDQKTEQLTTSPSVKDKQQQLATSITQVIKVVPEKHRKINIAKLFAKFAGVTKDGKITYTVDDLPKNHDLQYKDGLLVVNKDSFKKNEIGKSFTMHFKGASSSTNSLVNIIPLTLLINDNRPYPNPDYHPDDVNAYFGKAFVKKYGEEVDKQLFINPFVYDEKYKMTYEITGLPKCMTTSTTYFEVGRAIYPILTISGTPTLADIGQHTVVIYASNRYGRSANPVSFNINITNSNPTITTVDHLFKKGEAVNHFEIAKVEAGSGEIKDFTIADTSKEGKSWASYGFSKPAIESCSGKANATTQCIYLTGTITNPTFDLQHFTINATNIVGGSATKDFNLKISGVPVKQSDLGSGAFNRGATFTTVDLASHFKNPIESGTINYSVTSTQYPDIEKIFGIKVDGDKLAGTIKNDAPIVTDLELKVTAKNSIGDSEAAIYKLTISPVQNPTITPNPAAKDAFTDGQLRTSIWIEDIKAGSGEIVEPITVDTAVLANHGLTVDATPQDACSGSSHGRNGKTECKLYVKATDKVKEPTYDNAESVNIKVNNSIGGSATDAFSLYVRGVPKKLSDLGSGSYNRGATFTTVVLNTHFKNPLESGTISYSVSSAQYPDVEKTFGIKIDSDKLVGTIKEDAPAVTDLELKVTAKNSIGDSEAAIYKITIASVQNPTITMNPQAETAFTTGDYVGSTWIADIKAGSGELEPVTIDKAILDSHNLVLDTDEPNSCVFTTSNKIKNGQTECKVYVISGGVKDATYIKPDDVAIAVKNSQGGHKDATFNLYVRGAPRKDTDLGQATFSHNEDIPMINLHDHFTNALKSGDMKFDMDKTAKANEDIGISIDANGNLVGKILPTATIDKHVIKVYAYNDTLSKVGYSKEATFEVTITATPPVIKPVAHLFKDKEHLTSFTIARIEAGEGVLNPIQVSDTSQQGQRWSDFGITTSVGDCPASNSATEKCVFVSGDITKATLAQQDFDIIASNSEGGGPVTVSFALRIQGEPQWKSDLGSGSHARGETFTIPYDTVADHFAIPVESGTISDAKIENLAELGDIIDGTPVYKDGKITIKLKQSMPEELTDKVIEVSAKNDIGWSDATKPAKYLLSVDPAPLPTITKHDVEFIDGQPRPSVSIATITSGSSSAELEPIKVDPPTQEILKNHGLSIDTTPADACNKPSNDATQCELYVKADTTVKAPTYIKADNFSIEVHNNLGGAVTDSYSLNVKGVPKWSKNGFGEVHQGGTYTSDDLTDYFVNPTKSGEITEFKIENQSELEKYGTFSIQDKKLIAVIKPDAPVEPLVVFISAKNDIGWSEEKDPMHYTLTIKSIINTCQPVGPVSANNLTIKDAQGAEYQLHPSTGSIPDGYRAIDLVEAFYDTTKKKLIANYEIEKGGSRMKVNFETNSGAVPKSGAPGFKFSAEGAVTSYMCMPKGADQWCDFVYSN